MELTVLNIELGATITPCFNLSSDTGKHTQLVRVLAFKKHFWINQSLRRTILKAVMTVYKCCFYHLWFQKNIIHLFFDFMRQLWKISIKDLLWISRCENRVWWEIQMVKSAAELYLWLEEGGLYFKFNRWEMPASSLKVLSSLPYHNLGACDMLLFKKIVLF